MEVVLDESIGRVEGPTVWRAWRAFGDRDWDALATLDEEMTALRPAASARRSSRAMGLRLLTTWHTLHPFDSPELLRSLRAGPCDSPELLRSLRAGPCDSPHGERSLRAGPTLPVAFACACASADVERRDSVEAFAYTRLAATVSAAMRLMPIGQTDAHALLARTLERVPRVVAAIAERDAGAESFTPAMDIAAMSQQYLHSRLFSS